MRKYPSQSPLQELASIDGRPISPSPNGGRHSLSHDADESMDLDTSPTPPAPQASSGRGSLSDSRIRTPLPSGPRLERMQPLAAAPLPLSAVPALPNIDYIKSELETTASRILSGPHKSRYTQVLALLLCWQDDEDSAVATAVEELGEVLDRYYHFKIEIIRIPLSSSDGCTNSSRWLSRRINDFADHLDTRDVLKVVYYNGDTFLDENRETILAR